MNVGLMKPLNIIVAVDQQGGFAKDYRIPWHFTEDFKHFQKVTQNSNLIMGRHTYEEILLHAHKRWEKQEDSKSKELLPSRKCFVISRTIQSEGNAITANSLRDAINKIDNNDPIFVIGGEKLFLQALPWTVKVYLTVIKNTYGCDKFFPVDYLKKNFNIESGSQTEDMYFLQYLRKTPNANNKN